MIPVLVEDGMDQGHVVQVGAAPVGVVQQHHVARVEVVGEVLEHAAHPPGRGSTCPGWSQDCATISPPDPKSAHEKSSNS